MTDSTRLRLKVGLLLLKYTWLDATARWKCRFRVHRPWKLHTYTGRMGWICSCRRRWWPTRDDLSTFLDLKRKK